MAKETLFIVVLNNRDVLAFHSEDAANKIARATGGTVKEVEVI